MKTCVAVFLIALFAVSMLAIRHSYTGKPCASWMDYGTPASNTEAQDHALYASRGNCK